MDLCSVCSHIDLKPPVGSEQPLGSYDELLHKSHSLGPDRSGCGGCAFFCAALLRLEKSIRPKPEFRGLLVTLVRDTGRLSSDLFLCASSQGGQYQRYGRKLDICTGIDVTDQECPFAHPIPLDPRDSSCFDTMKRWMRQCKTHESCSQPVSVTLPKRVIEIPVDSSVPPRLRTTKAKRGQYVILSHCWGSKRHATLIGSLLARYHEAIDIETLPRNFSDAIEITRKLGFRYLWIDALCIVQDSVEDWSQEAERMASYYGLSTLMISATVAEDSSSGILTEREAFYSPHLGAEKRYCLNDASYNDDCDIESSVLATRGWTTQERMLAPRIVHYAKRQMVWECAGGYWSELPGQMDGEKSYWKLEFQQLVTKALSQASSVPCGVSKAWTKSTLSDRLARWHAYIWGDPPLHLTVPTDKLPDRLDMWRYYMWEYSPRHLTVPTDKLHAIAGVARILNDDNVLGTYLAGIWSKCLAASLSWGKMSGVLSSPPVYTGPSWSWASVTGGPVPLNTHIMSRNRTPSKYPLEEGWATRSGLRLLDQHIVLQDEHNAYGAVLEESYIIVEGVCITYEDHCRLSREIYQIEFSRVKMRLDKGEWRGGQWYPDGWDLAQDSKDDVEPDRPKNSLQKPESCDFVLLLVAERPVTTTGGRLFMEGFLVALLLSWVDREANVARRIGIWDERCDQEQYDRSFQDFEWKQWKLKLV